MKIEYYPKTMYEKLFLNPEDLIEGLTISTKYGDDISLLSLFPRGVPFQITGDPHIKVSPEYHIIDVKKETWHEFRDCAFEGDFEKGKILCSTLEKLAKGTPRFFKESNDLYERKEIQQCM